MVMEEEVAAPIDAFFVLLSIIVPREEWEEFLCLPIAVDNIVGVEVCDHKW